MRIFPFPSRFVIFDFFLANESVQWPGLEEIDSHITERD